MKTVVDTATSDVTPAGSPPAADDIRESALVLFSLAVAVALFWAFAWVAIAVYPQSQQLDGSSLLPEFRPASTSKAQERLLFLFGLLCIPTLPLTCYHLGCRWYRRATPAWEELLSDPRFPATRDALLLIVVSAWLLYYQTAESMVPHARPYLAAAIVLGLMLPALMARTRATGFASAGTGDDSSLAKPVAHAREHAESFSADFPSAAKNIRAWAPHLLAAALIAACAAMQTLDEDELLASHWNAHHFELLLGAVNQVQHGKTVLVDTQSQYGILYPYLAALSVSPIELSVAHLSWFFAALELLALAFLYLALCAGIGRRSWWPVASLAAIVGIWHPFWGLGLLDFPQGLSSYYFQYSPIRVIWGAFFIWYVGLYFRHPRRSLLLFGYAAAGCSALWNLDTGLVVLIAWTAVQAFDVLGNRCVVSNSISLRRVLAHVALASIALLVTFAGYAIFAGIRSGRSLAPEAFWQYQKIFYGIGHMAMPMQLLELWQGLILIYAVTVAAAIRHLWRGTVSLLVKWQFFVALYGLGIFSYYQGRSHVYSLICVSYPAILLAAVQAASLARCGQGIPLAAWLRDPVLRYRYVCSALFAVLPAFGLIGFCRSLPAAAVHLGGYDRPVGAAADLARLCRELDRDIHDSPAIILAPLSNYLHLKTHSWSALPFSSPSEIILQAHVVAVQEALDRADVAWLIVDKEACRGLLRYLRLDRFEPVRETGGLTCFRVLGSGPGLSGGLGESAASQSNHRHSSSPREGDLP